MSLFENEHPWEALVWQVRNACAPNFQGQCEGAAGELADLLRQRGISAKVIQGMFDHPYDDGEVQSERSSHVWVEIPGYILDPTAEQFDTDEVIVPMASDAARRYEGYEELPDS